MKKTFVLAVALSLSTLCFAGQKSYEIVISKAATVGALKLAAGTYKVKVDGANATFTDAKFNTVSTPVKVETVAKKTSLTAVDASTTADGEVVTSITLGGTTTKLDFSKQPAATN